MAGYLKNYLNWFKGEWRSSFGTQLNTKVEKFLNFYQELIEFINHEETFLTFLFYSWRERILSRRHN